MSIHGFVDQNGQIQKYDYDDLENKPTIPAEVLIDDTLTEEGQAADAKAVGDALDNITIPVDSTLTQQGAAADAKAVGDAIDNIDPGLSPAAKQALLEIFQHVAYIDEHGQDYYDALEIALAGGQSYTITLNLTGCESSNTATSIIEGYTYLTTIIASSGYTLEGATATATMGGQTVTGFYNNGTISIPNVTGDLVITVTASSSVASISAVFTQGQNVVYTNDSLDSLRQYLTVTATYSDSTTDVVTDYTLSGTLESGTSTITVSYGGKTDTFSVTVTQAVIGWYYPFNGSILSSGTEEFGLSGVQEYATGHDGTGFCYYHHVTTEGDSTTDPLGLYVLASTDYPTWGNSDFTIATWFKGDTANRGHMFNAVKKSGSGYISWSATASNIAQGWSVTKYDAAHAYLGIRMGTISEQLSISLTNAAGNAGGRYQFTAPSGFDTTQWHHYALTRSGATLYFFIDGNLICNIVLSASTQIYSSDHIIIGNLLDESNNDVVAKYPFSSYHQDLYINVGTAKWTENFDPSAISY